MSSYWRLNDKTDGGGPPHYGATGLSTSDQKLASAGRALEEVQEAYVSARAF
jgi:hypothetical protein